MLTDYELAAARDDIRRIWDGRSLEEVAERREQVAGRENLLAGYAHRSRVQNNELEDLAVEATVLDEILGELHVAARRAQLEAVRSAAFQPGGREGGWDGDDGPGFATGRDSARAGSAVRMSDVWRSVAPWDGVIPDDYRTGADVLRRAHQMLGAFDDAFVPRAAKERLAEQFDDPAERDQAARLALALSDPAYLQAWRCMMLDPLHGDRLWGEDERRAWAAASMASRSASLGTASLGFMLPLELDPSVILVNAGAANPWRRLATIKTTTSSTWNGVTSVGGTAVWLGEGAEASDNTPTTQQLQITPRKGAAWIFGSYESIGAGSFDGDTAFAAQVPSLLADMKDRLEADSFCNGNGTAPNPSGFLTAFGTAGDSTVAGTAVRTATDLYGLLESIGPRFRGPGSRVAWLGSLAYLDRYRMVPAFSGAQGTATSSLVDDSGMLPRVAGIPWHEMSSWPAGTAAGQRVVGCGDWSQVYIADRWPGYTLFEPMVKGTASGFPTGQSGWFYVWRSNLAITGTAAFKVLRLT